MIPSDLISSRYRVLNTRDIETDGFDVGKLLISNNENTLIA